MASNSAHTTTFGWNSWKAGSTKCFICAQHYLYGKVVDTLAPQFATNGGPIVLVQVENELNGALPEYVQWCGDMAEEALAATPVCACKFQVLVYRFQLLCATDKVLIIP